ASDVPAGEEGRRRAGREREDPDPPTCRSTSHATDSREREAGKLAAARPRCNADRPPSALARGRPPVNDGAERSRRETMRNLVATLVVAGLAFAASPALAKKRGPGKPTPPRVAEQCKELQGD